MTHRHTPNQPSKPRREKERLDRITALSFLLWDDTKPEGEEAVPEEAWEAVLTGPCNGDKQLIAEVCRYERWLRSDEDDKPFPLRITFPKEEYEKFLKAFLNDRLYPLFLLWDEAAHDWKPEERWEEILSEHWKAVPELKERLMDHARQLREARTKGEYRVVF